MHNFDSHAEAEAIACLDVYSAEMERLGERREALRAKSKDPEAFEARLYAYLEPYHEAVYYLESWDFVYLETLIKGMRAFLESEQPT